MSDLTKILLKKIASENLSILEVLDLIEFRQGLNYEKIKKSGEIDLAIDYRLSLAQMIAAGNYDQFGDLVTGQEDINERNFPLPTKLTGKIISVSIKLFSFETKMDPQGASLIMTKSGYHPGSLPELLALGALLPDLQRHFVIIASGFAFYRHANGCTYIPCLHVDDYKRVLGLSSSTLLWWLPGCRFLGVKTVRL